MRLPPSVVSAIAAYMLFWSKPEIYIHAVVVRFFCSFTVFSRDPECQLTVFFMVLEPITVVHMMRRR